jgi:hypothetical protein
MSICRTLIDSTGSKMLDKINNTEDIYDIEGDFSIFKKIVKFVDSNTSKYSISIKDSFLGSGSYGVVYKGHLVDENKIRHKVAIKIIKITKYESKTQNEKEVLIQNKANEIKKDNGMALAPKIFTCDYICSNNGLNSNNRQKKSDVCKGVQVIIMERKNPFDLKSSNYTAKEYADILGQAIRNYELLFKGGLYMYDVKPSNNIIDDNLNLQIIDFTPGYMYTKNNISGSFFSKLDKKMFEEIVGTIVQLLYIIHYIHSIHKYKTQEGFVYKFHKKLNSNVEFKRFITRFVKNYTIIYRYLVKYDFDNKVDKNMWKTFYYYTLGSKSEEYNREDYFYILKKLLFKYLPIEKDNRSIKTKKAMKTVKIVRNGKTYTRKKPISSKSKTDS